MCCCAWSCAAPCRDVLSRQCSMALLRIDTITTMDMGEVGTIRILWGAPALTPVRLLRSQRLEEVVRWSSSRGVYWSVVRAAYHAVCGGRGQDRERGGSVVPA